ncbi:Sensory box histidine kinase [Labilithrix luteola]|uniref:histidine kinase n=1 Tax=Labilithrix luteola TaxID=1391654 RepID=A0A0K1QDQ9_9BACT|nr:HAMP domain-containing sensor histidine kinase [Labilithrix luteola]AKV03911.1 Sensory box histidine kinase [Labilithrix luteola]
MAEPPSRNDGRALERENSSLLTIGVPLAVLTVDLQGVIASASAVLGGSEGRALRPGYNFASCPGTLLWLSNVVRRVLSNVTNSGGAEGMVDGVRCTALVHALADETGAPAGAVVVLTPRQTTEKDIESVARYAAHVQWLASASLAFAEAGVDYRAIMETVVRRMADLIGDACAIRVVSPDGEWLEPVAVYHRDPVRLNVLQEAFETVQRVREGITAEVFRTRRTLMIPVVTEEVLRRMRPVAYLRYLEDVGSILVVPLRVDNRVVGVATLLRDRPCSPYDVEDQALLENLAERAALALEIGRLYREATDAIHARDDFLFIAGHELRTPLTSAKLQTALLRRLATPLPQNDELMRGLDQLERQHRRLGRLVDELLDASRIRDGFIHLERETFDMVELVRDASESHARPIARSGSKLIVDADEPVVGAWDRERVEQVVTNLLLNAVKFGNGRPIEMSVEREGELAHVVVRDHGSGIAPEDQTRIFDRFERAVPDGNYGGLGIGLYVAQQIAIAHGGSIRVDSEPGDGAKFTLELPLRSSTDGASKETRASDGK